MAPFSGRESDTARLREEVDRLELEVRRLTLLRERRRLERYETRTSSTDRILSGVAFAAVVILLAIIAN
ncbi:hypothetical protein [Acuticoccus yangtzensis]|uniref:hypothetical protein n=1 Tax=Acuticoccus yangtzensis TaxID=1443441 RepID=UPI0009499435|nr:hypothetical protein [Acuticoccus yangtzensis]ORE95996.1 hypothetical protein ATO13_04020 [Stappia sp. 22II-S9-Z10]